MKILRRQFVFCMVFAILVATICYPLNAVHATSLSGIKNIAVTRLIDEPTTKKTLFVITNDEDTYHIIVDANITTVGTETLIDLSATLYNPLNETITASARIPDTFTDAPFYNGPVEALWIHLDSLTVNALRVGLPIVIFVALFLEAVFIAAMIVIAPVLTALKLLLDDGFFIWASLPWVLLTLLQDAHPANGIDLYFPVSPWSVLRNLIFNDEIYYIRTNKQWWRISEIDVYIYIWIWRIELFDYYTADPLGLPNPPIVPPVALFVWTPYQPVATENVTFYGLLSYAPSGHIVDYSWSLGDGDVANGMNIVHIYANPGNYDVTLTVTDNNTKTNSTTHTIEVLPRGPVMRVVPDYLQVNVTAGLSVTTPFYVGETVNQTDLLAVHFTAHDLSKIFDSQTIASGNVAFDKNGITVPKGTGTEVKVTFYAPPGTSEGQYTGNITVTSANANGTLIFVNLIVLAPPVGGEWAPATLQTITPTDKLQPLALWISLALAMAIAASFVGVRRIRKRQN